MKFILVLIPLLFSTCATWKKSNLGWEASWGSNENVLLYTIEFEEKNSLNPLEGTTIKRNYKTKLEEYRLINDKLEKKSEFEFPYWILINNLFYNSEKRLIFFIRGEEKSGYGTEKRIIALYKLANKNLETLWSSKQGEYLWKILPSPDSTKLAFITTSSATSKKDAKLHIWDGTFRSIKILSWLDASFEHAISWNEDSTTLYLAQPEGVFKINLLEKTLSLQQANEFPKCFIPSTSFGFRISNDGKEIKVNPKNRANSTIVVHEKFIPFEKIPKTNKFQNPNCPFVF